MDAWSSIVSVAARATAAVMALLLVALMLCSGEAAAQTLGDVTAAQGIRSDLESGNTRRGGRDQDDEPADDAPAEDEPADEPAADEEEEESPDAAAPAAAPKIKFDKWDDSHSVLRSRKPFVSYFFLPLVVLAFLLWVWVGDWVNRDVQKYELGYGTWNLVVYLPFVVAFFTLLLLPFAAALPLLIAAGIVPLIVYAVHHNRSVESHQKVFTKDWWRYEMSNVFGGMSAEKKAEYEKGAPVELTARGGIDETKDKANLVLARQSPGFVLVKELISQMVGRRSEQVLLDYRAESVAVKHYIDGVWHNGEAVERKDGDVMLAVVKQLANLNPGERVAKQAGEIGAKFKGNDYDVAVQSQGVKTGERVVVKLADRTKKDLRTFVDLGLREKIANQWSSLLGAESGLVVCSAQPGAGVTTLTDVSLMETDRLMRDFFSVEDVHHPERDIENIVLHTYDSKKGETAGSILEKLQRLYPNAYVLRDLGDPDTAKGYCGEVADGKLVITSVAANDACEALLRILQKKAPRKEFAMAVTGSLNMRLIRLLCKACRVAYEPAPELLKKLGIPEGKVTALYRPPTEEEAKKPCPSCGGLGYQGRTGLFELLPIDDKVREVLVKAPKMELLRKAGRAAGMRTHQEEGVLLVAKGATSLQELQRVLKG